MASSCCELCLCAFLPLPAAALAAFAALPFTAAGAADDAFALLPTRAAA